MRGEWNAPEDGRPSLSRIESDWTKEDRFIWRMEIRERLSGVVDLRLGELVLKGSWDGTLVMWMEPTVGFLL